MCVELKNHKLLYDYDRLEQNCSTFILVWRKLFLLFRIRKWLVMLRRISRVCSSVIFIDKVFIRSFKSGERKQDGTGRLKFPTIHQSKSSGMMLSMTTSFHLYLQIFSVHSINRRYSCHRRKPKK